jgi:putative spermidine/putrescine transport system substrate-binding protein
MVIVSLRRRNNPMAQIFISYSRSDRSFVDDFVPLIHKVYGNDSLWFDDDIHGGANWWDMILSEIDRCVLFIFLISNEALESPYCQAELREAIRLRKQILPIIIRRLSPPYPGDVPDDLRAVLGQTQAIELIKLRDPANIANLYGAAHRLLQTAPRAQAPLQSTVTRQPPVPDRRPFPARRLIVLGGLAVVAAGVAVILPNLMRPSGSSTEIDLTLTTSNSTPDGITLTEPAASMQTRTPGITPEDADEIAALGDGEGSVDILAWAGGLERGDTDPNFDWVTDFEAQTGCTVNSTFTASSDEMFAVASEESFDIIIASGDISLRLISSGLVQPVELDFVPSWSTVDERLQHGPWHIVDGVHYGVPFQWIPNVLMYNTDVFRDQPPESWSVVFMETTLPDGESNVGRVQAYDGPIYIADAALYLMVHNPELGISDPFSLDRDQFNAALDLLRQQRALVGRYWHDAFSQIDDFYSEEYAVSTAWPYQVNLLKQNGAPVSFAVPIEGITGTAETSMLASDAEHPNCAYRWLEWSLTPKVQGDIAAWLASVPAVPAACQDNVLLGSDGCAANGMDTFDRVHFWRSPTAACQDGRSAARCIPYHEWATSYLAVIGGR